MTGSPRPKGRPRAHSVGGRAISFHSPKDREAEQDFKLIAAQHAPERPWTCPLRLEVRFDFRPAKSWPRWKREAALQGTWRHVSRPDLDNLVKLVTDALNELAFEDDRQVVEVHAQRTYGEVAKTWVRLVPLDQARRGGAA